MSVKSLAALPGWNADQHAPRQGPPAFPDLPPAAVALARRIWGHLHGLVSLEVYGHLRTQTSSPDKLFREEIAQLTRTLGLPHRR
ncbi:TetR-like C-terminal domain-containing protein [Streptomyces sp. NPDC005890]|uniref:TetR-like C-terminal domain-containing protein n=1 Tax=Streptomyces sp. NPDC005890 TaxID=3154568 RepID=UPI0033C8BD92